MQFYYLFHLRSCAAATAGCCGSAYCGGSRTVFVQSLLETLFLNFFTSVFVYGLPIFLLVAFVLGSAFCASSNVPTFVYRAAAAPVGAAALPVLDPDRGIRVKLFVKGQGYHRTEKFVPHGLTARQVLDQVCAADADVELVYPAGRKYSDDEIVAAPVVIVNMRLGLRGGAKKKKKKGPPPKKKTSPKKKATQLPPPPKKKSCCCCISGKRCPNDVFCEATVTQLERMVNDETRSNNKGTVTFDPHCYYGTKKQLWVCEDHMYEVARTHVKDVCHKNGGHKKFKKRDFLHNILKATKTHEDDTAIPVQPGSKRARVSIDTRGDWILAKGQQIRFDILLTRLRGIVPTENGEVTLSEPGDPTYSRVDDVSLTDKLGEQRAKEFHKELADLATMEVVDPKDSMASKPAHLCGKMGDLFREVGLDGAAWLCDLIAKSERVARGVDAKGNKVTFEENLRNLRAFNAELRAWHKECEENIDQRARGAQRYRGFISEVLYELYLMNEEAMTGILALMKKNKMSGELRSTLPFSASNETMHSILRGVDKHLRISTVARHLGRILLAASILQDPARSWTINRGVGTYRNTIDESPERRRAALADYERTGKRAFVLKTKTERDKEHGVARRARVGEAPKILTKIAAATNVTVKNFKLTFRDAWVRSKYGRKASKGRSMLEMAMAAPHLLKREGASGNGQAFPVARAFIVDGDAAWELVHSKPHAAIQKVGTPTIKCRQSNLKGVLELDVLGKEKYVVPYKSIKAMAWDFIDASLPANVDGIVVVTFAIVTAGRLQLLTLELLQKDKNTCRMFANLEGLAGTLFKSALVAGGKPSPQAQLLRAAHREGGSGTAVLKLERDEAPWRRVAVRTAVEASRGLVRIAELDAEEPPPLSTILKKYKGGDGITMRKEAIRSSSTTKAKRGRPKAKEDDGARVVRAELEDHEEAARYQKDGGKVLGEKWVGLCARDDEYRFTGEIVGMKWVDDTEPPQICAEIRSYDKKVTETYCVYDLPAMVIAAEDEQLLDVLLEYDPPEDEFDLLGDEEAERTMAQPLGPDDDDGAEDDDVDLEL